MTIFGKSSRGRGDRHASDDRRRAARSKAHQEAGLRSAGRRRQDDVVGHEAVRGGALERLECREHLADGSGHPGTADLDDGRPPPRLAEVADDPVEEGLALRASVCRCDVDRRPEELCETDAGIGRLDRGP